MPIVALLAFTTLLFGLLTFLSRANELFCVASRNGRTILVRGKIPRTLLAEFREALANPPSDGAVVTAQSNVESTSVSFQGSINEYQKQVIRNLFAASNLTNAISVRSLNRPPLVTFLGFVWLTWLFERS